MDLLDLVTPEIRDGGCGLCSARIDRRNAVAARGREYLEGRPIHALHRPYVEADVHFYRSDRPTSSAAQSQGNGR